jgi:hypothetical protein
MGRTHYDNARLTLFSRDRIIRLDQSLSFPILSPKIRMISSFSKIGDVRGSGSLGG